MAESILDTIDWDEKPSVLDSINWDEDEPTGEALEFSLCKYGFACS